MSNNNNTTTTTTATTTLINLTPHAITLRGDGGSVMLPKGESIARVVKPNNPQPSIDMLGVKLPVQRASRGEVTGLPAPTPGTVFIASAMVAEAARRPDVMSPGDLIRDEAGQPVAANGLVAYAEPATPATPATKEEINRAIDRLQEAVFADDDTIDAWEDSENPEELPLARAYAWARLVVDGHHKYPHAREAWWAIRAADVTGAFILNPVNAHRMATIHLAIGRAFVANIPDAEQ